MIESSASSFSSANSFVRGRRHLFSHLLCFGRHTITGLLRSQDRSQLDWSADYRLYSHERFEPEKLFGSIRSEIEKLSDPSQPLVVAMDDSLFRKTGRKIQGVRYQRDPLSPPFNCNLVLGQRVLQLSAALPQGNEGAARLIPIDFYHAALPAKPRKDAAPEKLAFYQQERAKRNINVIGAQRLEGLRRHLDESGSHSKPLWVCVDNRFTNGRLFPQIPERTTVVGRVRKDAVFYFPPREQPQRGRKRKYGERCPTPEQLLNDHSVPWENVNAYAAGKRHNFQVKTLGPIYSPLNKGKAPLRMVVVKPVQYRKSKNSKLERRDPAFLICTDPDMALAELLQAFLWRWDIEVNFRDEKTLLGVGQAQVRGEESNQNAPALAVAAYSFLLLAAVKVYGTKRKLDILKNPKWYKRKPGKRPATNQLINQLRYEMWASALKTNFRPLSSQNIPKENGIKFEHPLEASIFSSMN